MSGGELNRSVTLRQPTIVRNTEGGEEATYIDALVVRANIEKSNQVRAIETSSGLIDTDIVTIRYAVNRVALNEDWLIKYDGVDHVIHTVEVIGKKEWIRMTVKVKNG